MTTLSPLTGSDGLAARLRPALQAAADELDQRDDIPGHLLAELRDAGALRLLTPRELGGHEASLPTVLQVYEEFGQIDASVAWIMYNGNYGFIGALLDPAGTERIWAAGAAEPIFANSSSPGAAVRVEGGYRLSGHWKIVSGVNAADWVVLTAVIDNGSTPQVTGIGGMRSGFRQFAVPAEQVTIKNTWHVSGMRATGSNDVTVNDLFVPEELSVRFDIPARIARPLYRPGYMLTLVSAGCSTVVLGIAAAAIEEMVRLAAAKDDGALAGNPRVQAAIAESDAELRAARLLLYSAAEALQAANEAGSAITTGQRADLRAAMSHAGRVSRRVLGAMYELGSSSSLYTGNPLERLFRDGMTAVQHLGTSASGFVIAGRIRLGLDPDMPWITPASLGTLVCRMRQPRC
jgi:indole-3-acetate monooxygenase